MTAMIHLPRVCVPDEGAEWLDWSAGRKFRQSFRDACKRNDEIIAGLEDRFAQGIPILGGGVSSYPFEGLDVMINSVWRKVATQMPDPSFLGLFTSQTPTTVPAQTAVLATATGVTEATGGGYGRASVPSASWPVPTTTNTTGRTTDMATPISFAESTGQYTVNNVNGFLNATAVTAGIAIFYSNFTSGVAIVVNQAGIQVRVDAAAEIRGQ